MEELTIGQLAKRAKVNVETIRYYERRGLVPEPPRRKSGYRKYPGDSLLRIHFIKRAKDLGFSLKEVAELLSLRVDPGTTCGDVMRRAEAKMADIEVKIRVLQRMKRALGDLVISCSGQGPTSACPILEALDTLDKEEDYDSDTRP